VNTSTDQNVRVAAPLFTTDARDLHLLARPKWQRRVLAWVLPVAAGVLAGLHTTAVGEPVCTSQSPCRPDALGTVAIGLLFGAAFAGFMYARLAPWIAAGFVVSLIVSERVLQPEAVSPAWLYIVDAGFVGLCVLVSGVSRDRRPTDRALQWLVGVRRERPPPVQSLPRPGGPWRLAGRLLLVVAVACLAWGWYAQRQADAQQRAASRAVAEVTAHPDESTVAVRWPGGTATIGVLDADEYPIGSRMDLYVDDRGLHQPVSEPYDATGWLLLGVFLAALAAAAAGRGVEAARAPRRLFEEEQPVTEVSVLVGIGVVAVYAGDARPGEPAVMEIRTRMAPAPEGGIRPASLFGVPAPGHWCAVVVEGETLAPARPLSAGSVLAPPYGSDESLRPVARGPLRAEEVAALRPTDREAPPDQLRFHVRSPLAGYAVAAGTPLALMLPVWALFDLSYPVALLIAAVVMAASCALSWRVIMRARIAWNGRGIAIIGAFGEQRVSWSEVDDIRHDRDTVTVHTGQGRLVVGAGAVFGLFGRRDRGAEELANALRHARDTGAHDPGEGLPRLERPRPPLGMYAVWLLGTPALAWLLQVYSNL
jgi:hypothetical protein